MRILDDAMNILKRKEIYYFINIVSPVTHIIGHNAADVPICLHRSMKRRLKTLGYSYVRFQMVVGEMVVELLKNITNNTGFSDQNRAHMGLL